MTKFELHCHTFGKGCGSDHCFRANRVVLCKVASGSGLPCDILFVGEAPGEGENVLGKPFVGPAGRLLDRIIDKALGNDHTYNLAFTNVVGCIPRDDDGSKSTEPSADQIEQCKPRLESFIDLADPKLIVCVGKIAYETLEQGYLHSTKIPAGCNVVKIDHPAFILRSQVAAQPLMVQRNVVELRDAVAETFDAR